MKRWFGRSACAAVFVMCAAAGLATADEIPAKANEYSVSITGVG